MSHILLLSTGGTISAVNKGSSGAYCPGVLTAEDILSSIHVPKDISVSVRELCSLDSNDLTFAHLFSMLEILREAAKTFDGIVITHGTDTLEETAFFLSLTLNIPVPVVLTGAMRPATAISADGPANLKNALMLAASSDAAKYGTLVCMNDTIFSGLSVYKKNSFLPDAFSGQKLGFFRNHTPYFSLAEQSSPVLFSPQGPSLPDVAIAYYGLGMPAEILISLSKCCSGIVVAGTGDGVVSRSWAETISSLSQNGTVFVRSSRCTSSFILPGLGMDDNALFTIPARKLNPQKARILLSLALNEGFSSEQIRSCFSLF